MPRQRDLPFKILRVTRCFWRDKECLTILLNSRKQEKLYKSIFSYYSGFVRLNKIKNPRLSKIFFGVFFSWSFQGYLKLRHRDTFQMKLLRAIISFWKDIIPNPVIISYPGTDVLPSNFLYTLQSTGSKPRGKHVVHVYLHDVTKTYYVHRELRAQPPLNCNSSVILSYISPVLSSWQCQSSV